MSFLADFEPALINSPYDRSQKRTTKKTTSSSKASIEETISLIRTNIKYKQEFFGVGMREIINGIDVIFFGKENKVEKELTIKWEENLISDVLEKKVKKINGIETGVATERRLLEMDETIQFVSKSNIYPGQTTKGFEQVVKLRGQSNEAYRRMDCDLLIMEMNICQNYFSRKSSTAKKKNKGKNRLVCTLQNQLQQKIECEEEVVSEDLGLIAKEISSRVAKIKFLRWAISVYSRGGCTAYEAMKNIMRLPSVSTLKSYINERQQHSG
ncbi:8832_t:CDS:2 [Diversispora eburnea]|uniref:8832_t:CDS:1 n=1 Tax=Diversispora eburnea TaxID=1213867 RepID=A0A9N8Z171_9GLOM|nr:8832_t:CDS:2 [Diversispora eburnea]